MFKLIALFTLLAVASARPGLLEAQTSLEAIGTVVHSIPTAITHQSQTQIHSQPILSQLVSSPAIIEENDSFLTSPVLSSHILSSGIYEGHEHLIADHGGIIGDQASILQGDGSFIGDNLSLVGDGGFLLKEHGGLIGNGDSVVDDQSLLISGSGQLTDSIELNGLHH